MYPDICCSSGIHVSGRRVSWCKHGITLSHHVIRRQEKRMAGRVVEWKEIMQFHEGELVHSFCARG